MLIKLSQPDGLAISIDEAKKRLRVDHDDDDDDIEALIRAATARVEQRTGRFLLPVDLEFKMACWQEICIPVAPIRSVDGVEYFDGTGAAVDLADADWWSDSDGRNLRVGFRSAPALSADRWPIRFRFSAGYDDPEDLGDDPMLHADPMDGQAILMLVGHWYQQRETAAPVDMRPVPAGFEQLVAERRIYR